MQYQAIQKLKDYVYALSHEETFELRDKLMSPSRSITKAMNTCYVDFRYVRKNQLALLFSAMCKADVSIEDVQTEYGKDENGEHTFLYKVYDKLSDELLEGEEYNSLNVQMLCELVTSCLCVDDMTRYNGDPFYRVYERRALDLVELNRSEFRRSDFVSKLRSGEYLVDLVAVGLPSKLIDSLAGAVTIEKNSQNPGYRIKINGRMCMYEDTIVDCIDTIRHRFKNYIGEGLAAVCKPMIEKDGFVDVTKVAEACHLDIEAAEKLTAEWMTSSGVVQKKYCVIDTSEAESWRPVSHVVVSHEEFNEMNERRAGQHLCLVDNITHAEASSIAAAMNEEEYSSKRIKELAALKEEKQAELAILDKKLAESIAGHPALVSKKNKIINKYIKK